MGFSIDIPPLKFNYFSRRSSAITSGKRPPHHWDAGSSFSTIPCRGLGWWFAWSAFSAVVTRTRETAWGSPNRFMFSERVQTTHQLQVLQGILCGSSAMKHVDSSRHVIFCTSDGVKWLPAIWDWEVRIRVAENSRPWVLGNWSISMGMGRAIAVPRTQRKLHTKSSWAFTHPIGGWWFWTATHTPKRTIYGIHWNTVPEDKNQLFQGPVTKKTGLVKRCP